MNMCRKINLVLHTAASLPCAIELLNRFISAKAYRAVAKPDRQTDGGAKPRLRRIVASLKWMRRMLGCAAFADVRDGGRYVDI